MPHILIVDDDKTTCGFIEELLASPGRQFTSAYDPDDAIKRINETPFDLLITDLNLNAARSGLDVLRTFASARPSSPVILISGFGTLETAIDAVRAGAFDFISKPFEIGAVKATVERALRQGPMKPREAPSKLAARKPRSRAACSRRSNRSSKCWARFCKA